MARRTLPRSYRGKTPDEILEVYPEKFMECRLAHEWSRRAIWEVLSDTARERTVQCKTCGTTKSMIVNNQGHVVRKAYTTYVSGYLTPKSGLVRSDFAAITYVRDFDKALAEGRVRSGTVSDLRQA